MRIHFPLKIAAEVPAPHLDEGLVGALHDALRADIDPRARGHLPVHHEPLAIELVETVPGRPVRHEIGVGDQHARRVGMGAEHADRLAGLHEQRLVALEAAQARDDAVERLPVARGATYAAVNDKLARPLGDVGIEIVHQHPERRFGQPALGAEFGSVGRADDAHVVDAAWRGHWASLSYKPTHRHCERKRSNPAIVGRPRSLDCFVAALLAMTAQRREHRDHRLTHSRIASRTRLIVARVGAASSSLIGVGQFPGAGHSGSGI